MKTKYSAFSKFTNGSGKMEFSNSINKLQKLILIPSVVKVIICEADNVKNKLFTLSKKVHKPK